MNKKQDKMKHAEKSHGRVQNGSGGGAIARGANRRPGVVQVWCTCHAIEPVEIAVVEGIPEQLSDKRKKEQATKEQHELINGPYSQIGELTAKLSLA